VVDASRVIVEVLTDYAFALRMVSDRNWGPHGLPMPTDDTTQLVLIGGWGFVRRGPEGCDVVLGGGENKFEGCQWLLTLGGVKIWRKSGEGVVRWRWMRDNPIICEKFFNEVSQ